MSSRKRNYMTVAGACLLVVGAAASIRAQAPPPPTLVEPTQPRPTQATALVESVPLRVEVVLSRSQGAKKISSLPYTLIVGAIPMSTAPANPALMPQGQPTYLRLGVDVYTGRSVASTGDGGKTSPEYQYVGTNIDCRADYRTAGTYRLYLNLNDTTLVPPSTGSGGSELVASVGAGVRRFNASNTLTVRDGQVTPFTIGTDPLTGETIRVDVTATAIK
jgi:hypothetical protein